MCRSALQIKAVLCAALYPNVAVMHEAQGASLDAAPEWNDGKAMVSLHQSSVIHRCRAAELHFPHLVYLEKVRFRA